MSSCFAAYRPARSRSAGMTLIEVMFVLLIIGILVSMAVPAFLGARDRSSANVCQANLRRIQDAKEMWAMQNNKGPNESPTEDDLVPHFLKSFPKCPQGGDYTLHPVGVNPTCSVGGAHRLD